MIVGVSSRPWNWLHLAHTAQERPDEGSLQGNAMRVSHCVLGNRTYIEAETLYGMVLSVGRMREFEDYGIKQKWPRYYHSQWPTLKPTLQSLCLNSRWLKDRVYHPQRRFFSLQDITLVWLNSLHLLPDALCTGSPPKKSLVFLTPAHCLFPRESLQWHLTHPHSVAVEISGW